MTVCKNNPHDQHVFNNTLWPFITKLPAPVINLSSQVLVQRHVNAMFAVLLFISACGIFRRFDKARYGGWFLSEGESPTPADEFMAWLILFNKEQIQKLDQGLNHLLRHTCLKEPCCQL